MLFRIFEFRLRFSPLCYYSRKFLSILKGCVTRLEKLHDPKLTLTSLTKD